MYHIESCTKTDQTHNSVVSSLTSIEVPINTDLDDPKISKTVLNNDPDLPLSKERIEIYA